MLDWKDDLPERLGLELPGGIVIRCDTDAKFNAGRQGLPQLYMVEEWEKLADSEAFREFLLRHSPQEDKPRENKGKPGTQTRLRLQRSL
jgi:hypothetical protein